MIHILKRIGIDTRIVAKIENNVLEYDDELIVRIIEELPSTKLKRHNLKVETNDLIEKLKNRLYSPYSISEREKPEFEIYRYKREI
jgi:hypothetical protein